MPSGRVATSEIDVHPPSGATSTANPTRPPNSDDGSANATQSASENNGACASAGRSGTPNTSRSATAGDIDANKVARQKRKKAAAASAELAGDKRASSIKDAGKAGKINAQLAHCILALHYKRGKDVRGSWNICRASLTKHGYLKGPYKEAGKVSDVRPTQKGVRRAMQHAFEKHPLNGGVKGSPPEKFQKFKNIFREIEPTV